jgi:hypothetical protein
MTPDEVRAENEGLQAAYQQTFGSPIGKRVMLDLVAYCHGRRTTFDADQRAHAFKEGQRDVFLRICEFTNLSIEEIYQLRK